MITPRMLSEGEVTSTSVKIKDDGLGALVTCFGSADLPLALTMSRGTLELLRHQIDRELKRVSKLARGGSSV